MTTTDIHSPQAKRIGILAAMPEELQTFLDEMPDEHQVELAGRTFWVGHWQGHVVIAVLSGIGKVPLGGVGSCGAGRAPTPWTTEPNRIPD